MWLPAEALLPDALARAEEKRRLDWTPDAHGRPFPEGILGGDGRLFGSLSHSGVWAAAAVSRRLVGLDIQEDNGMPEASLQGVLRRFHPLEGAALSGMEGAALRQGFFRQWALKESVMKLTGRGLGLPMDSFAVVPGAGNRFMTTVEGRPAELGAWAVGPFWIAAAQWSEGRG